MTLLLLACVPKPLSTVASILLLPLCVYAAFVSYGIATGLMPIYELIPSGSSLALVNIIFSSVLIALVTAIAISPLLAILAKRCFVLTAFICVLINYLFTIQYGFSEKWLTNAIIIIDQLLVLLISLLLAILLKKSVIISALSSRMAKAPE